MIRVRLAAAAIAAPLLILGPAAGDQSRPPAPRGCISIEEFKHLPVGATRQQIDVLTGATGNAIDFSDENTRPPHRFVVVWYRLCEGPGTYKDPPEPYADYARVEVWFYRHTATRKAYLATLLITSNLHGRGA